MFIRTERLFLRPGWPEDLEEIFEALNGDAVPRTLTVPGLPRSRGEIRDLLEGSRNLRFPQFMIWLRAPGGARLVGHIGLVASRCDMAGCSDMAGAPAAGAREGELVYWIKAEFAGRGFAGEAVRAMLDQARSLGHARVVAYEPFDNEADARVLLGAGFSDTYRVEERYCAQRGGVIPVRRFEAALEWHVPAMVGAPVPHATNYAESLSA